MDEPMEESGQDVQTQSETQDREKPKVSSILRPGSMDDSIFPASSPRFQATKCWLSMNSVMMTITVEDYEAQYWPKLESAINQLLTMTPGDYVPISYEQMYSCVYKCVCKQFSERLYSDLLQYITTHLEKLCLELQAPESHVYIEKFNFAMNQYLQALGGIVPIFNYMNRFYIESKLKTDLNVELRKLFVMNVADKHVPTLIPLLVEASAKPFWVSPSTMANLIKNLYSLKPEFAELRPHLFAKYIPNILPPTSMADLDKYIEETKQMQRDLMTHPLYTSGDQSRKRPGEEEPAKAAPLSFLPKNHNS